MINYVAISMPSDFFSEAGLDLGPLIIIFAMIGKFGISGAYSTVYLYSTEIFPTVVR